VGSPIQEAKYIVYGLVASSKTKSWDLIHLSDYKHCDSPALLLTLGKKTSLTEA
jgi:hypothetical protein